MKVLNINAFRSYPLLVWLIKSRWIYGEIYIYIYIYIFFFFFYVTKKAFDWSQCKGFEEIDNEGARLGCCSFLFFFFSQLASPHGLLTPDPGYVILG